MAQLDAIKSGHQDLSSLIYRLIKIYFDSHAHMAEINGQEKFKAERVSHAFEALTYWSILCLFGASTINQTDKNYWKPLSVRLQSGRVTDLEFHAQSDRSIDGLA